MKMAKAWRRGAIVPRVEAKRESERKALVAMRSVAVGVGRLRILFYMFR